MDKAEEKIISELQSTNIEEVSNKENYEFQIQKINFLTNEQNFKKFNCDLSINCNIEESKIMTSPENPCNINEKNNKTNPETSSPKKKISIEDFEISYVLGKGSYAKVVLARNIHTLKEKKENEAIIERNILLMISHPNIITLHSTFQDPRKLYFILDYCPNKDLSEFLKTQGILSFELAQYYAAEIVLALEYIHNKGIYHRDLKPENIILDEKLHLKIVDFATAAMTDKVFDITKKCFVPKPENFKADILEDKIDLSKYHVDTDLIGTPEYISPESLFHGESSPSVDLWALGCIIYLFFHGVTPFKDKTNPLIFEKIKKIDFKLKDDLSESTKDLISKLLVKDPNSRLGAGSKENNLDISALKRHTFFANINFDNMATTLPPLNAKKITFAKIKQTNSSDSILSLHKNSITKNNYTNLGPIKASMTKNNKIENIPQEDKNNLYSLFHKNVSNQNLLFKDSDFKSEMEKILINKEKMCNELEFLYGRNTCENENFNEKIEFDLTGVKNPFGPAVDINEECENICHSNSIHIVHCENKETEDEVILEDVVQKKSPWFHYNKRILKLYKSGKVEYLHPTTLKIRGTIVFDHHCSGVIEDEKKFNLITKSRKFIFKLTNTTAIEWVNKINEILTEAFKKFDE